MAAKTVSSGPTSSNVNRAAKPLASTLNQLTMPLQVEKAASPLSSGPASTVPIHMQLDSPPGKEEE